MYARGKSKMHKLANAYGYSSGRERRPQSCRMMSRVAFNAAMAVRKVAAIATRAARAVSSRLHLGPTAETMPSTGAGQYLNHLHLVLAVIISCCVDAEEDGRRTYILRGRVEFDYILQSWLAH